MAIVHKISSIVLSRVSCDAVAAHFNIAVLLAKVVSKIVPLIPIPTSHVCENSNNKTQAQAHHACFFLVDMICVCAFFCYLITFSLTFYLTLWHGSKFIILDVFWI